MEIKTKTQGGVTVAVAAGPEKIITDVQSALDLMVTVGYNYDCSRIAIDKDAVTEDFFILSTRLAGEILQKSTNYHIKIAIFGDFSGYASKALKDFIRESNAGKSVFFTATEDEAIARLAGA